MEINIKSTTQQQATTAQLDRLAHDYLGVGPISLDDQSAGCRKGDTINLDIPTTLTAIDGVYSDTKAAFLAQLGITVNGTEYQRILDPAVLSVLKENFTHAAEDKFTTDEFKAITSLGTLFNSNTDIVNFMELKNSGVTNIGSINEYQIFSGCTALAKIDLSNIVGLWYYPFAGCTSLKYLIAPKSATTSVNSIGTNFLLNNQSFRVVDLGVGQSAIGYICGQNYGTKFIFRYPGVVTWNNGFSGGSFSSAFRLFVPEDQVEAYKVADRWSTYASQIFAIGGEEWQTAMQALAKEESYTLPATLTYSDPYIDYHIYGLTPPATE